MGLTEDWQKNEEKPCSTCLKHISPWHFLNFHNPGFPYLILSVTKPSYIYYIDTQLMQNMSGEKIIEKQSMTKMLPLYLWGKWYPFS